MKVNYEEENSRYSATRGTPDESYQTRWPPC